MKRPTFRRHVAQAIADMFFIWRKEIAATFRDQGVLIFFVLVPLAYPLIYAFIYTNETLRDVPAVVVDDCRTSFSRDYLRRVDATPEVRIASYCSDMEEARLMMRERQAYGIIYIPASFSSDVATGRQAHVSLFCDMSGLLYYKSLVLANTQVSLAMNADIKARRAGNTTDRQDEVTAYPIEYEDIALYNPANGFAAFLLPAVLVLIIQQTLLLGIGLSAGTAREGNRFRDLVPVNRHYHGTLRIVMGKALSYFMVYVLVSFYVLCVVPRLFNLVQIGDPWTLLLFMLPYLAACIFFAMTASIAIRNRETCMLIFVFTSVPLLFLSGISWPRSAMPAFWEYFSYLFPSTFGINGFVRINSMGATLNEVATEYHALWLQTGIYFVTACVVYRYQILLSRRHVIKAHHEALLRRYGKSARTRSKARALPLVGLLLMCPFAHVGGQEPKDTLRLRVMSYNVENLFDTHHDSLKNDQEFLPDAVRHWTYTRYRRKLDNIARVITAVGEWQSPALVALCEVENDRVLTDLTRYSALGEAGYRYVMTHSPDERGIDVALLYQRHLFKLLGHREVGVPKPNERFRPTRHVLHVSGMLLNGDTLDVLVCHFPSRSQGRKTTEPYRLTAATVVKHLADSLCQARLRPQLLIMGDLNDEPHNRSVRKVLDVKLPPQPATFPQEQASPHQLYHLFARRAAEQSRQGTYKYKGEWNWLDHLIVSGTLLHPDAPLHTQEAWAHVADFPFLLAADEQYGGRQPFRTYHGVRHQGGFSDHLPVYVDFQLIY